MSVTDNQQGNTPLLQRVRCGQCCFPLIQIYQGDLLYTLQCDEEEIASQPLPAYAYRTLTDPLPLICCPRCHTPLSSSTVTVVLSHTRVTEESPVMPRLEDL